jgi:hypothetical protein
VPLPLFLSLQVHLKALDEIDAGMCDGMTYDQIAETMPEEFSARASNKLVLFL